jgi:hypothetical protein
MRPTTCFGTVSESDPVGLDIGSSADPRVHFEPPFNKVSA